MSDTKIDLFGGLKIERQNARSGERKGGPARVTVEFTAPDLVWHADENAIAGEVAQAIADTIRENLLGGRAPDGSPLPPIAPATQARRRFRLEQAGRGGEAAPRVRDGAARARARENWVDRFRAPKLGMQQPMPGARTFGVESGLLARSVAAIADAGVWRVFFAAIRARLDRSNANAVLRVFKRIGIWNAAAMSQPRVQQALRNVRDKLLTKRGHG